MKQLVYSQYSVSMGSFQNTAQGAFRSESMAVFALEAAVNPIRLALGPCNRISVNSKKAHRI